jgi:hypothetical protein
VRFIGEILIFHPCLTPISLSRNDPGSVAARSQITCTAVLGPMECVRHTHLLASVVGIQSKSW